jgi:hypothetical protein
MKVIKLESSTEQVMYKGVKKPVTFEDKSILLEILNTPFEQGTKPSEMKQRLKLIDSLEKSEDSWEIDEVDFGTVKNFVDNFNFGVVSRYISTLVDKFA